MMDSIHFQYHLLWFIAIGCLSSAFGQLLPVQTQFASNIDRQPLSLQQQGQILSDIQQHHRFDLSNRQNFQPQHFRPSQSSPYNQQYLSDSAHNAGQQFGHNSQENFGKNEFLNTLPLVNSLPSNIVPTPQQSFQQISPPTPSSNQVAFPSSQQENKVVQHLTQTSFQPGFTRNSDPYFNQQQFIKPRPTTDPIAQIERQIKNLDPNKDKEKIQELREKQAIIEKHNQFVEKQYEKALKKAQLDHEEYLENQKEQKRKLYQKIYKPTSEPRQYVHSSRPRVIYPEEVGLFEKSINQYYVEHPTTTTTTTTTTTPKPSTTVSQNRIIKVSKSLAFLPTALPQTKTKTIQSLEDLDQLQKQYRSQKIRKDDLLEQLRLAIGKSHEEENGKALSSREISLSDGKKIQLISADDKTKIPKGKEEEITLPDGKKVTVIRADDPNNQKDEEVILPSGHQVQIIRTTDPKAIPFGDGDVSQEITLPNGQKAQLIKSTAPVQTKAASSSSIKTEEITLPDGQKVEVIKTSDPSLVPGAVQLDPGSDLEKLILSRTTTTTTLKPPKAILDEITKDVPDSNYELLKTGASGSLETIGKNLPNQKKVTFVLLEEQSDGTLKVQGIKGNGKDKSEVDIDKILKKIKQGEIKLPDSLSTKESLTTEKPEITTIYRPVSVTVTPNSFASGEEDDLPTSTSGNYFNSQDDANIPILKTNIGTQIISSTPKSVYTQAYSTSTTSTTTLRPTKNSRSPHILNQPVNDQVNQASSFSSTNQNSIINSPKPTAIPASVTIQQSISPDNVFPTQESLPYESSTNSISEMPDILKQHGMYAMAKYLKQSGLDQVLNETGPYTVFVPTDKAFKALLIQLGGPERADEKFKENPRLLSGLLLHHVIPGAFKIETLQDEMTGVSLAGTQLRVNQYNMHDKEWNDIKITTINGAQISDEKYDIEIPQGYAHAIDRVMFPLPVGDIVQTLQSDRERRFTSFLRAIFASGLADMLQGTKVFTLFAPTEKAFAPLTPADINKIILDKVLARELVMRHLLPGTLYTNGMRYYQIKDSLLEDKTLTFSKQSGKVKVNNNNLTTQNIPATNGVIHAIDSLL
ncbi:unnamed protein product [Phaedon cochleariae]|uniref:FAS1 domain-containing protein n=1 Tax=Phaedon cochleariae TaxID=80249 RepID=A0A9P0GUK9_PHACE|nr:unnamed protein product [Phaedon cochleariae]